MDAKKLAIIMQSVLQGEVGIDLVWQQYRKELEEPTLASSFDEIMSLVSVFFRYSLFLMNNGYTTDALVYADKSLDVLRQYESRLDSTTYHQFLEAILKHKAGICNVLHRYREGYKALKELCSIEPRKDEYKIARNNCFFAMVNKALAPIYVLIIVIWAILALQQWVLHVNILPTVLWNIGFWVWMILLVIQFVVPYIAKKLIK